MSVIYTTCNVDLKNCLAKLGIKSLICGRAIKDPEKLFWVFERNDKLNSALDSWFSN